MVKYYPKIGRIPWGKTIYGKRYLTDTEINELLSGMVVIEEKIDGKNSSVPISIDNTQYEMFVENCRWVHSIPYNKLPNWNIILDFWDYKQERFLNYMEKRALCNKMGISGWMAPLLGYEKIDSIEDLTLWIGNTKFSDEGLAEGIVVKNYEKQIFGKLVRNEFITGIETHWMFDHPVRNRLI